MTRNPHLCHAMECPLVVPRRLLMCAPHWRIVPWELKKGVLDAYIVGQEKRLDPTNEYLYAAEAAVFAVAVSEGKRTQEQCDFALSNLREALGLAS